MIEWNNRTLIAGVSGTGKTYAALLFQSWYVKLSKRSYYVFLSDNQRDYDKANHPPSIRPKNLGFKLVTFDSVHASQNWNWKKILQTHKRLYIETGDLLEEEITHLVNQLSGAFWALGSGLFAIDEAWNFLAERPVGFERLGRGGRKKGVDLLAITQRVVDLHPKILSQFNLIVSFRLDEKNDVERISRYFSPINGKDPRFVIPSLSQGQYLIKATETGEQEMNSTLGLS